MWLMIDIDRKNWTKGNWNGENIKSERRRLKVRFFIMYQKRREWQKKVTEAMYFFQWLQAFCILFYCKKKMYKKISEEEIRTMFNTKKGKEKIETVKTISERRSRATFVVMVETNSFFRSMFVSLYILEWRHYCHSQTIRSSSKCLSMTSRSCINFSFQFSYRLICASEKRKWVTSYDKLIFMSFCVSYFFLAWFFHTLINLKYSLK